MEGTRRMREENDMFTKELDQKHSMEEIGHKTDQGADGRKILNKFRRSNKKGEDIIRWWAVLNKTLFVRFQKSSVCFNL